MRLIEIAGMSRSGKTSIIEDLAKELDRLGMSNKVVIRPMKKFEEYNGILDFNECLIKNHYKNIELNKDKDYVLLDRGFYDRQVLLDYDLSHETISRKDYEKMKELIKPGREMTSKIFLLMVSPSLSLERLPNQKKLGKDSSELNTGLARDDFEELDSLYKIYEKIEPSEKILRINGLNTQKQNLTIMISSLFEGCGQKDNLIRALERS